MTAAAIVVGWSWGWSRRHVLVGTVGDVNTLGLSWGSGWPPSQLSDDARDITVASAGEAIVRSDCPHHWIELGLGPSPSPSVVRAGMVVDVVVLVC